MNATDELQLKAQLDRIKQASIAMRIILCLVKIGDRKICRTCKDYAKCVKMRDLFFE
jgi:hypothetical protein